MTIANQGVSLRLDTLQTKGIGSGERGNNLVFMSERSAKCLPLKLVPFKYVFPIHAHLVTLASVDTAKLVLFYTQLFSRTSNPHSNVYAEFQLPSLRLGIFRPKQMHRASSNQLKWDELVFG